MSAQRKHTEPPDDERLAALQDGEVHGAERDALLSHLADDKVGDDEVFADTEEVPRALEPPPLRPSHMPFMLGSGCKSKGKWEVVRRQTTGPTASSPQGRSSCVRQPPISRGRRPRGGWARRGRSL
jgi:hypothetical protein